MSVFRSFLVLLVALVLCLTVTGCKEPNGEEPAVPDTVVLEKNGDQAENQQQTLTEKEPPAQTNGSVEKRYLSVNVSKALLSKEELLAKGNLVVKVLVQSKDAEEMANPDGKAVDSTGTVIDNRLVTSYTAEVLEVYKGDYTKRSIIVKTAEGRGLSPDLILYGEDEEFILSPPLTRFALEPGMEYVLILVDNKGENDVLTGYFIFGPEYGCFAMDEKGVWNNKELISSVTFEDKTIQGEIVSILNEKNQE